MIGYKRVGAELVGEVHFIDELGKFIYLFFLTEKAKRMVFATPL